MSRNDPVPQHLSMVAVNQKYQTLAMLDRAGDLGWRHGFAGGRTKRGGNFQIPEGHVITHIGDTDREFGTYMETFPKENVAEATRIGMVRNLHPDQFKGHS